MKIGMSRLLAAIVLVMVAAALTGCGMLEVGIQTPTVPLDTPTIPTETETPPTEEPGPTVTKEAEDTEAKETEEVPGETAIAWYGRIVGLTPGSQYDDYLSVYPEGSIEIGIEGETAAIEEQIVALRDKPEPGRNAHFWGVLHCPALDYGGCQLRVTRLRVDGPGPFFDPDLVEGWVGTIVTGRTEPGSGGDDYFLLDGDFAVQYGIEAAIGPSGERELETQIVSLRDTGTRVRIWGSLMAGIPDWNGTQIEVSRLEIAP